MARPAENGFVCLGGSSMYAKEAHGGRSLFIANIPAFYNKGVLADAFVEYGTVLDARLDDSEPGKTRCGIVTFAESIAAQELLATASDSLQLPSKRARDDTGVVKRLLAGHRANMLSTEALQEAADSCMLLFEKQEERDSARRSDLRGNGPDEDGFVTVTHKGKLREADGGIYDAKRQKKKKGTELKNFYRHQIREERKGQLLELRERFEEDKARIARLKNARKFRPF